MMPDVFVPTVLGDFCDYISGVTFEKSHASKSSFENSILILRSNNIDNGINFNDTLFVDQSHVSAEQYLIAGDILICMSSGSKSHVGKSALITNLSKASFGAFCGVLRPKNTEHSEYLSFYMQSELFRQELSRLSAGSNINNLKKEHILDQKIKLPQITQLKNDVEHIRSSFEKISRGYTYLVNAEKQIKLYRQSVLKDAFEGELTADWRAANPDLVEPADKLLERIEEERKAAHQAELDAWADAVNQWEANGKNGKKPSKPKRPNLTPVIFEEGNSAIMPENWVKVQISSVLNPQSGSTPKGISNEANGTVNYIKVDDMNTVGNEIKIQNSKMMLNAKNITDFSMNLLPEGTVIFPKRGGAIKTDKKRALSKPSCVDTNIMGLVNSSQSILNDYIYTFMESFTLFQISDGSNVPQINNGSLKAVAFPICSPEEQQEVCRIIGEKFEQIENLKTSISLSFSHSNALRQSILKQAFSRHELLENVS